MYLKVFEKVFEISNTLVMYLNTNTNTFFLNVFEILSITLKKVFKYFKYKYFMYLSLVVSFPRRIMIDGKILYLNLEHVSTG